jgi:hypothetical protein
MRLFDGEMNETDDEHSTTQEREKEKNGFTFWRGPALDRQT